MPSNQDAGFPAPPGADLFAVQQGHPAWERRFLAFLDVNFDAFYDWDVRAGAIVFSPQIDSLFGHEPGGFPRTFHGWLEQVHPGDRDRALAALDRARVEGLRYRDEYRMRRADGSYLLVQDQAVILTDEAGRPAHFLGAMRDVTREREAERALRESEELYQSLFRHAGNPAFHVDEAGRYLDANSAALTFLECDKETLLRRSLDDDFPAEVGQSLTRSGAGADWVGPGVEVDVLVGGHEKTVILTHVPCTVAGRRTFFCLGTDITVRKRVERELAASEEALRTQARLLEERNTALRVIVEQREQDRRDLEERIGANIEQLIRPTLDRLSHLLSSRPEAAYVEALGVNLAEIVGPYARRLRSSATTPLTRRETEVADLVRLGKTTAEIAQALHISPAVVSFHRGNIRRKLGLGRRGPRLTTHLAALARD